MIVIPGRARYVDWALQRDAFVRAGARASAALEEGLAAIGIGAADAPAARPRLLALAADATDLADRCAQQGHEEPALLARTCARCMELLAQGQVSVAHAYPLLAASLDTLRQAFEILDRPPSSGRDPLPLRAARYELETLFPVPGTPPGRPGVPARPDVPVEALVRRPRSQD